ncbi:hypothetical protein Poly21_52100 [Allorhodopirellula heiligendammensis]|uniref:Uncharacterized protein n=2 Tax=Allorhodopirellula heiligendammensis TaxID=2714739 RepID=A0A5C6BG39_9BACT|nr:hypothetical protein Poly21_52100 [Allorhodopirellula heiligendammensis]
MVQHCAAMNHPASPVRHGRAKFSLKDPVASRAFVKESQQMTDRLISTAVDENLFWEQLSDELVSAGSDAPLTPALCEIALLRSGHSQLQSEQTAAAIHRSLDSCRRLLAGDQPRLADQLRLRYAPLKQTYEAYGPGLLRLIGNQIWSGDPPTNWWPNRVTVHAVQPLQTGAAGRSTYQSSVWIEAVLTDISPEVPEWLRLVYQLTQMAIDSHTRTHALSGGEVKNLGELKTPTELPWSLGIIPLIFDRASEAGMIAAPTLPIATAIDLGWTLEDAVATQLPRTLGGAGEGNPDDLSSVLQRWWCDVGRTSHAFPIALKDLSARLAEFTHTGTR